MTKLRQRPRLDLANALTGEIEVVTHLIERASLSPVEPEPEPEHHALTLVERRKQTLDLGRQERIGGGVEGAQGAGISNEVG